MASVIAVPNETHAHFTRTTRDGRNLTYEMNVLQQPQRARACGSGAKSSADRRPVDPPPVVELKIFDGEGASRRDITFQHNANFFLYTTLESARPIATARGTHTVAAPHPVLTGTPVAGMAYLDRPTQAGYFIFPDLSVRHEGKFRLSFNLYEELKETKDMDPEGAVAPTPSGDASGVLRGNAVAHVFFRLEVKSAPFTVYSAKKFPGLAESTQLSRLVAEQGCRVRIRRDVRMRRRETKPGKEYDGYSDDEHAAVYPGENRYATPDAYHHERSSSAAGNPPTLERRPSAHELPSFYPSPLAPHQSPQTYPAAPPPPSQATPSSSYSHLQFGSAAPPAYQPGQPPSYANREAAPGHYAAYSPAPPPPPASHHRPTSSSGSNYAHPPTRSTYQHPPLTRSPFPETEYGHPSMPQGDMIAVDAPYRTDAPGRSATPSSSHTSNAPQLPPLKSLTESACSAPPTSASSPTATDLPTPGAGPSSVSAAPTSAPTAPVPSANSGGKRTYGRTFDDGSNSKAGLHNGARPEAVGQDFLQVEFDDGSLAGENDLVDLRTLSYRRADGSRQYKQLNAYSEL